MFDIAYCSDKYQYTMGKSFYHSGMKGKITTFNLFFRKAPDNNNWAVVSGIEEAVNMILSLGNQSPDFFKRFIPDDEDQEYREYLSQMKFTGDVYAMREGEIVFPKEPILTIQAPIIEAQVLEVPLLSIMNHQMAVATKASRVTRSTHKPVTEFGSRRAHGPWAAVYGGKAAYIGGCVGSSNIMTNNIFNTPCSGTMAHSYVTSYGNSVKSELIAFDSYIKTHKGESLILLIDTYDTLKCGLKNAIKSFKINGIDDSYEYGYGIRLDSGDITYLSEHCREMLDAVGLKKCQIFATNSLDEYIITELERQNAKVDAYGVGDAIATSKHNPCFGNVYKLVEVDGEPILKRSEDKSKLINPGFQVTYRIIKNGIFKCDITALRGDSFCDLIENKATILTRAENDRSLNKVFAAGTYEYKMLQNKVIDKGECIMQRVKVEDSRAYYLDNLSRFNHTERRLINPHFYKVNISDDLYNLKTRVINNIIDEIIELDNENPTILVVDMQNDFISGSLACQNAQNAVAEAVKFINNHPECKVIYTRDFHPSDHCSFVENGGIWPSHCVENVAGSEIEPRFYTEIVNEKNRPSEINIFSKGTQSSLEEYSAFESINAKEGKLYHDNIASKIYVVGVATEYCVKETVLDLLNIDSEITIVKDALAYVDIEAHNNTISELQALGVTLL